jgi:DNA-binding LacI/PurR family transcriptional regulator
VLPKKPVTLAEIAKRAGVSVMTVSRALRKQSNISPGTQKKIQDIADQLGYRPNPLVSALMTYRRAAKPVQSHVSLGFITNFPTRDGWKVSRLYQNFFDGVAEAADRHGYGVETFWLREPGMTPERLTQILLTRSIHGLLIAPLPVAHGELDLQWEAFSAVTFGYSLTRPLLHRAVNHQFRSMRLAMRELRKLGYKRLGLALPTSLNERVDRQWVASFLVEQLQFEQSVPLFVIDDAQWNYDTFRKWFNAHKPDAVIGHEEVVLEWLRKLGARVPDDVGFAHLNCADQAGQFAGIFQNGPTVGGVAVDFLIGMIHRNERGVPSLPHSILVEGTWVPGKTVRAEPKVKAARSPRASQAA